MTSPNPTEVARTQALCCSSTPRRSFWRWSPGQRRSAACDGSSWQPLSPLAGTMAAPLAWVEPVVG